MPMSELRPSTENGNAVIEVWYKQKMIGQLRPIDGPGFRLISERPWMGTAGEFAVDIRMDSDQRSDTITGTISATETKNSKIT